MLRGRECEVQHIDEPDIVTKGEKTLSIKHERPNTHTPTQIFEKHQENLQKYDKCIVVTASQNLIELQGAVGQMNVITRGSALKAYLDNYLQKK